MKKLARTLSILIITLYSCQEAEVIKENIVEKEQIESRQIEEQVKPAIIIDGKTYFSGMGYSATQDRLFAPAIDDFDMLQSTDIPKPIAVEVAVIKTNEDLEKYMRKTKSKRVGGISC